MRVLFIPCGIGMGHASRSLALAEKMRKEGIEVMFASYGAGYDLLKYFTDHRVVKLPEIKFYGGSGELNFKYTAKKSIDAPFNFLKSIYSESRIIKEFKPDVVVSDSHYSVPITCKVLGIPCVLITNELTLDFSVIYPDDKTIEYLENGLQKFIRDASRLCDTILIPDIKGSVNIPKRLEEKTIFTGPFLKRNPDQMPNMDELREELGFDPSEQIVLATVGGTWFGKKLLENLADAAEFVNCDNIIMVTGPRINVQSIPSSRKINTKQFIADMMGWMKMSNLVVSLAGHTTSMELASLGARNIMVPIQNHPEQIRNAQNMQKHGLSLVADMNSLNSSKLANQINDLLQSDQLNMGASNTRKKFSKYHGTEEAVTHILQCAERC
jgi:uncharacterized protein (TIGR00661 family)